MKSRTGLAMVDCLWDGPMARPTLAMLGLVCLATWTAQTAETNGPDRAKEWWPERAVFQATGGVFKEKPSSDGSYIYDAADAWVFHGQAVGKAVPADKLLEVGAEIGADHFVAG